MGGSNSVKGHLIANMSIDELCVNFFSNTEIHTKLGDMAAKVALQNFDYRYATILFFNSALCYGVELFLHVYNYNIIIDKGLLSSTRYRITSQYVIFGSDVADLEQVLDKFREMDMTKSGKFIIVCQSRVSHDCDEKEMLQYLWKYKIVNVIFIKSIEAQALGYTYFPISEGDCNNIKPINTYSSNDSRCFTTNHGKIFKLKLKKLNFCPLFVSTYLQAPYILNITDGMPIGSDGDLLRIIAYGLNTSLEMMTPHRGSGWGHREKNGTWMGSLADIDDELANISMTSAAVTLSRFSDFEMSRCYGTMHMVWVTHPANRENPAFKLLHPFRKDALVVLAASYIFIICCAFVIKPYIWSFICRNTQWHPPSKSIVFYSWMICMGQTLIKLPTKSTFLHLTINWIYFCCIIRTLYQVYLISSLKGKFYDDQFESIEDAIKANYPFGGGAALLDYYIDNPEVHDNWTILNPDDLIPTALNISKGMKFVLAINWDTLKTIVKKHKIHLHVLPQKIISSPTAIFLKKHSPLTESVNLILSRLIAAGFTDYLHNKYTSVEADTGDNEQETLTIVHLTACYLILSLGWAVSTAFFLLEIYFGKMYKRSLVFSLS